MSLTERQKEIALEIWIKYRVLDAHINDMFGEFLSRIREEQEAAATILECKGTEIRWVTNGVVFGRPTASDALEYANSRLSDPDEAACVSGDARLWRMDNVKALFTDCKELVEALERWSYVGELQTFESRERFRDEVIQLLAKHAERMKE